MTLSRSLDDRKYAVHRIYDLRSLVIGLCRSAYDPIPCIIPAIFRRRVTIAIMQYNQIRVVPMMLAAMAVHAIYQNLAFLSMHACGLYMAASAIMFQFRYPSLIGNCMFMDMRCTLFAFMYACIPTAPTKLCPDL
jgi:hypothetical protein